MAVEFISGKGHYDKVVERVASVRKSLWIGTADIKDLHVKAGNSSEPFLAVLAKLPKNPHSSATPTNENWKRVHYPTLAVDYEKLHQRSVSPPYSLHRPPAPLCNRTQSECSSRALNISGWRRLGNFCSISL